MFARPGCPRLQCPGQVQDPFDVGADNPHLGGHRRHLRQAVHLFQRPQQDFFRQVRRVSTRLRSSRTSRCPGVAFAQLGSG